MFDTIFQLFHTVFSQPVLNVLVLLYRIFLTIGLPGAFGFAIIAITVLIRVLLYPLFRQQLQTADKMKLIKPKLDVLQKKYKKDPQALQKAQLALYKKEGINPASGCLAALVQIPLFLSLYRTLQLFLQYDEAGKVVKEINSQLYSSYYSLTTLDPHFFGLNLALSPSKSGNMLFLSVPVITAGLQFLQSRITMPQGMSKEEIQKKKEKNEKLSNSEEFQQALGTQMKYFFPLMIGWFSYSLPLGLSLYWNIFSLFSIGQHYLISQKQNKTTKSENQPDAQSVQNDSEEMTALRPSKKNKAKQTTKKKKGKKRT